MHESLYSISDYVTLLLLRFLSSSSYDCLSRFHVLVFLQHCLFLLHFLQLHLHPISYSSSCSSSCFSSASRVSKRSSFSFSSSSSAKRNHHNITTCGRFAVVQVKRRRLARQ